MSPTPGMSTVAETSIVTSMSRSRHVSPPEWPADVAVPPAAAGHFAENSKNSAFETF